MASILTFFFFFLFFFFPPLLSSLLKPWRKAKLNYLPFDLLDTMDYGWAPVGITRPYFGSHWIRKYSRTFLYSCTLHHFSLLLSLLLCGWLDSGQPLATPLPATLPCGWVDGTGGILGCIHVCTEKEVGLLLSQGKIPGGKFLACLRGRISNQRPAVAPLLPGLGNPINCVRQRELVSIDPHSAALWLADKGHSHVETNARAEQPGGGPVPTSLPCPLPFALAWSCFASVLIIQEALKERFRRFGLAIQMRHSPLVDMLCVSSFSAHVQGVAMNWLIQHLLLQTGDLLI